MLKLEFHGNTPAELTEKIREYVKGLKGTRGGKAGDDDEAPKTGTAPAPLPPPANGGGQPFSPAAGFAPPAGGAGPTGAGPFAAGAPAIPADVQAIVAKINARIDAVTAEGRFNDQALGWFRQQCGAGAEAATVDQLKTVFLYKLQMPQLVQIAGFMGAQA